MFASLIFNNNSVKNKLVDKNIINSKLTDAQLSEFSFSPVQNINDELDTNVFETSLGSTTLPNYMATSFHELVMFLNDKTTGYTWAVDYDKIVVSHASPFSIVENTFSSLILGCTNFITSSTSHEFDYVGLFPYSEHVIMANELFPAREMSETGYYFKSFLIEGDEFWSGKVIDNLTLMNTMESVISISALIRGVSINVGVKMNDGTIKLVTLRKTRPFSMKLYFSRRDAAAVWF